MDYISMNSYKNIIAVFSMLVFLSSCVDQEKFENIGIHSETRWEYAPNMYHSEAYEPLTQIYDDSSSFGEDYNSNPYNPFRMNMREPAKFTIKRNKYSLLPYHISKDSLDFAAKTLVNPISATDEAVLKEGKALYVRYCAHCHGAEGNGDGPVNDAYKGVANLAGGNALNYTEGHIYHVITHGKGRMWPHASIVEPMERWKIAAYIKKELQNQQQ